MLSRSYDKKYLHSVYHQVELWSTETSKKLDTRSSKVLHKPLRLTASGLIPGKERNFLIYGIYLLYNSD